MDLPHDAIRSSNNKGETRNMQRAAFFQGHITATESLEEIIGYARKQEQLASKDTVLHSRFVMRSLDDEQKKDFLAQISTCMQPGEIIYFECR